VNILVADIGGTKSRFGIFSIGEQITLIGHTELSTHEYNQFSSLIQALPKGLVKGLEINLAILGIAGPIVENLAYPPHISFEINVNEAIELLGVSKVLLVNDMLLHAYASLSPDPEAFYLVKKGEIQKGQRGIFAPGTGFGQCGLVRLNNSTYKAVLSEGGHSYFPFDQEEKDYMRFLWEELKIEPTFDNVVSGPGFLRLYRFLRNSSIPPHKIGENLRVDREFRLWMARLLGRASKHIALTYLAIEGLYISGGVVAKNPWILKEYGFLEEFLKSKAMVHLLEKIPIWVIKDELATLWGGAYYLKFGPFDVKEE